MKKYFPVTRGLLLAKVTGWIRAVDNVDFSIEPHETFGLVGESGCGKSTLAKLVLRVEKPSSGSVLFRGQDITDLRGAELKSYRSSVQAVFQDPYSSLNPRMRIGSIVAEPLQANGKLSRTACQERVEELLAQVGLAPEAASLYPHEFSGGQRQRIALARALVLSPSLIVLDEPISGLDVSIRAQTMNLLKEIQNRLGVAYLLIAHNLATIRHMSHRVGVMYLGQLVESSPSEEIYSHPLHPYTQALLAAALPSHPDAVAEEEVLPGEVPSAMSPPPGCRFHPRCRFAKGICAEDEPQPKTMGNDHQVSCHLY